MTPPDVPPVSRPMLLVLALSDSFESLWTQLARELGLELVKAEGPGVFDHSGAALGVVAGGGVEEQIEPTLLQIVSAGMDIVAVGAEANHRIASTLVRAGASEYFALPQDVDLLRSWLGDRARRLAEQVHRAAFTAREQERYRFEGLLGASAALRGALDRAAKVIPHGNVTVLITGETGTGKELLARAIHYEGPRRAAPFVDVNCAAIPDQLLESELFGHEKGAFTSATASKPGLFEMAHGGTLFLDEIGHLPLTMQGKLLRALQERVLRRVGGTRPIPVDVRVIAATHLDLAGAVRRGEFREDLFHRLSVVPIKLPPLRARREDIVPLATRFLAEFSESYGLPPSRLERDAERALLERMWTGNVRELRNVIERAVILAAGREIAAADLEAEPENEFAASGNLPFPATLAEIGRAAAQEMVALCGGNKSDAARRLDISRARLQRLLDATAADALSEDDTDA